MIRTLIRTALTPFRRSDGGFQRVLVMALAAASVPLALTAGLPSAAGAVVVLLLSVAGVFVEEKAGRDRWTFVAGLTFLSVAAVALVRRRGEITFEFMLIPLILALAAIFGGILIRGREEEAGAPRGPDRLE